MHATTHTPPPCVTQDIKLNGPSGQDLEGQDGPLCMHTCQHEGQIMWEEDMPPIGVQPLSWLPLIKVDWAIQYGTRCVSNFPL